MNFIKKAWLIPLLIVIVIALIAIFYRGNFFSQDEPLSREAVSDQIEKMYEGTVDKIKVQKGVYIAELTRTDAVYQVEVDMVSGNILSLKQLTEVEEKSQKVLSETEVTDIIAEHYDSEIERMTLNDEAEEVVYEVEVVEDQALVKIIIDALSGEVISEEPQGETDPKALISREQAVKIAFTQLKGDVEYVEFKQTENGGFYLIEIEQNNDNGKNLEAVIQIHAITGEILSVVWDD